MSAAFLTGVGGGGGMKTVDIFFSGSWLSLSKSYGNSSVSNGSNGADFSVIKSKTMAKLLCGAFTLQMSFKIDSNTYFAMCTVQGIARKISANGAYRISCVVNALTNNVNYYVEGTLHIDLQYNETENKLYIWTNTSDIRCSYHSGVPYSLAEASVNFGGAKLIFN